MVPPNMQLLNAWGPISMSAVLTLVRCRHRLAAAVPRAKLQQHQQLIHKYDSMLRELALQACSYARQSCNTQGMATSVCICVQPPLAMQLYCSRTTAHAAPVHAPLLQQLCSMAPHRAIGKCDCSNTIADVTAGCAQEHLLLCSTALHLDTASTAGLVEVRIQAYIQISGSCRLLNYSSCPDLPRSALKAAAAVQHASMLCQQLMVSRDTVAPFNVVLLHSKDSAPVWCNASRAVHGINGR